MPIIEAHQLSKTYTVAGRAITVLDDVTLSVVPGEFLVVAGSSGSGKTTLLSLLSGLDQPSAGQVILNGRDITHVDEDDLAPLRNRTMGFVFQSFHLVPSLTALENVMFPAELRHDPHARDKALALLERVGLARRAENLPSQLSGGEKQRVAICRALVNQPELIFADEPTGNLDSANGRAIMELLLEFQRERTTTLVMVTHSPEIAERAQRVIHLTDGRLTPSPPKDHHDPA
ncbi:MAG: ABC transporter ATP-binding protein [Desulfobacterales bacterium]